MRFINLATNDVVFDVRALFPETSLPEVLTDENLKEHGFATVTDDYPSYDTTKTKVVERGVQQVAGKWSVRYDVVDLDADELLTQRRAQAAGLEASTMSLRAIREAILTGDTTKLKNLEAQIEALNIRSTK